jgi:hypothetical protein
MARITMNIVAQTAAAISVLDLTLPPMALTEVNTHLLAKGYQAV